jgi:hypothetical protein
VAQIADAPDIRELALPFFIETEGVAEAAADQRRRRDPSD